MIQWLKPQDFARHFSEYIILTEQYLANQGYRMLHKLI